MDSHTIRRTIVLFAALLLALAVASCGKDGGGGGGSQDAGTSKGEVEFTVDESIKPSISEVPGLDGGESRPVGAIVEGDTKIDVVERELLVTASNESEAEKVAGRWNGEVVSRLTPNSLPDGADHAFLVRIEQVDVGADELEQAVREFSDKIDISVQASSRAVLETMAAASRESRSHGHATAPNWVTNPSGFANHKTLESSDSVGAPSDVNYQSNSAEWPYVSTEAKQSTGLDEAWELIAAMGSKAREVPMIIVDGGFVRSRDMPDSAEIVPRGSWGRKNPSKCVGPSGKGRCPYHGTKVASAAFAKADNQFGVAGAAGQVAKPFLVQAPAFDLGSILRYMRDSVPRILRTVGSEPRVVLNMSFGGAIPGGACLTGICKLMGGIAKSLQKSGILLVAAAGNQSKDIDAEKCRLGICWEKKKWVPCEYNQVLCVGGLEWNGRGRHDDSNYHTDKGINLYSSYRMWVSRVDRGGNVIDKAESAKGTSYSSPFVAGIAALVWSVAPDLSAKELRKHMQTKGAQNAGSRAPRVDAHAAVLKAVEGEVSPTVEILYPNSGDRFKRLADTIQFRARAVDPDEDAPPTITWKSDVDGEFGTGTAVDKDDLSAGAHDISVHVEDDDGHKASDSIRIRVDKEPPTVKIVPPASGSTFPKGTTAVFEAETFNPKGDGPIPDNNIDWVVGGNKTVFDDQIGAVSVLNTGGLALGSHQVEVRARVGGSIIGTDTVTIDVTPAPSGNITPRAVVTKIKDPSVSNPMKKIKTSFPADSSDTNGSYAKVELCGYGSDGDGPTIEDGDAVWFTKVKGSSKSYNRIGDLQRTGRCITHEFYLQKPDMSVEYRIKLRVTDKDGASNSLTKHTIEIFPPGPI